MIQGQSVKRQATSTLRCMQTLARVQSQVRARRIRMSEENQTLQRQLQQKNEKEQEKLKASSVSTFHIYTRWFVCMSFVSDNILSSTSCFSIICFGLSPCFFFFFHLKVVFTFYLGFPAKKYVLFGHGLRLLAEFSCILQQSGDDWNDSTRSKEQVDANLQMKQEAATRRERALAYAYTHQVHTFFS